MSLCVIHSGLAYGGAAYIMASVIYFVVTRSYSTPFNNALKKFPKLLEIKKRSVEERAKVFGFGVMASVVG